MEGTLKKEDTRTMKGVGLREGGEVTKPAKKRKRVPAIVSEEQNSPNINPSVKMEDASVALPPNIGEGLSIENVTVEAVAFPQEESKEARRQRKREKKLKRAQAAEATARMSESRNSIPPQSQARMKRRKKKSRHGEEG